MASVHSLHTSGENFIRGERSADWYLHQVSTLQMLNLFAATGHTHYAKNARLYLQLMNELPKTQPWLFDKLNFGLHGVRRSDRFWAGL